ncbi:hypothetical protein SAMN02745121_07707 [Nannocystis exedens]|uniref:Uncharacterized protein n=1 Tax=Nannocystis exedens TaxID=54 RepID=A0A1I2H3G4_9BACT|nr:hypothetical protein [Nannocystis exedens]PCC74005.1 hypothetical protein NAEX_07094 [Nannocystis exedens]SFF24675.1 hypothetical protein SAMN02745121_07707 [Nannocystis exedens]
MASPRQRDLLGTWIEDTSDPDEDTGDRYDDMMALHVLVLSRGAARRPVARYGQVYASNYGTDVKFGEGRFHCGEGRLVIELPAMIDRSNAVGMGYESRRSQVRACRFEFVRHDEDGEIVLTSHLDPGSPTVPAARFVRVADPTRELEQLDELAARVGEGRGEAGGGAASPDGSGGSKTPRRSRARKT